MSHYKVISMQAPHCGQCGTGLKLEELRAMPLESHKHMIGKCPNVSCERHDIRLEIPLTATRCMVSRDGTYETNNSH